MASPANESEPMERIWLSSYEKSVPKDVEIPDITLIDLIDTTLTEYRSKPAFHCMGATITYDKLDQYSREMAAYFQEKLGLKPGDRLAIMLPNILQYPVALFAALRAGLTVVNVNPLYTARELKHQLKDSGAETIVIAANFAHTLAEVMDDTPVKNVVTTQLGDLLGFPKSLIVNFVVKFVKKMVPPFSIPSATTFNEVLGQGAGLNYTKPKLDGEDLAFLQYTGGTTGVSKGAMLCHRNLISNIYQARAWIESRVKKGEEIIVTPLPLYHIFSLVANCFTFSSIGGANVLIPNPRDMDGFVKELKKWPFTAFTGVNTLFNGLLAHPEFRNCDFSNLSVTLGGGMAVQKYVADEWKKTTGAPMIQAYGLTETSPAASINPFNQPEFNGSIGLPISNTYISIRDDDGKEVTHGEPGEIWIKGPQVMKGYWQRPEETKKVLTDDGWLKTGDVATMADDGYVTIVDRKKDMILVSGFNVYPNEIEDVICMHEGVLEAAAIGVEDAKTGEAIKVFVVKKEASLTKEQLIEHCRGSLTGYKVPKNFEFRDDLPKTNVGKILRRALRESAS